MHAEPTAAAQLPADPGRAAGRAPRRARAAIEIASVTIAYSALALWWLWPLPSLWRDHSANMSPRFPPSVADLYLIVWALAWDTHALLGAPWRLFHANTFYPSTLSLAYSEHFLGQAPLFALPYLASGNPILAVNVLIFATYPACGLAMYLLARRWVGGPAAFVAGSFYAFCIWRYVSVPHLHMLGVQYLPLAWLLTERWLEEARSRDAVLLALVLALQALSSVYLACALFLAYAPCLAISLLRRRKQLDRRRITGLVCAAGAAGAGFVVTSIPYAMLRWVGLIPSYEEAGSLGLVPFIGAQAVVRYLTSEGVGPVGYLLSLLALVLPRRGRREPVLIAILIVAVGVVASFGPAIPIRGYPLWSPYRLLLDWVPGFSSVRLPSRFVVVAQLGFALLAGLGFARLVDRIRPLPAWLAAAATIALALASFGRFPEVPLRPEKTESSVPEAYRWLAAHGGGRALLELPGGSLAAAERMYFSTYHWLPIVDGYSGYAPATARYLRRIGDRLPDPSALQELVDQIDLGWILVHRAELDEGKRKQWDGAPIRGLEPVGSWGSDLLLRVDLPVRDDRRARFLSRRETLGGVPLAPLGPRCPGEIRLTIAPPLPWPPRSTAHIEAEVINSGSEPWPGLGFYPRHLVRLRTTLEDPRGWTRKQDFELPDDVFPGRRVAVGVDLQAPNQAHEYTLELELIQVHDLALSACGVAPLRIPLTVAQPPA